MIYTWKCLECNTETDVEGPMSQSHVAPSKCIKEKCYSDRFERVLNNFNFVLKGKGWYKDGY